MDYPFYIKPVADIPEESITKLSNLLYTLEFKPNHYFESSVATGILTARDYARESKFFHVMEEEILHLMPFDAKKLVKYEVNVIKANSILKEHSDVLVEFTEIQSGALTVHKIHIPIITNDKVRYGHRRSKRIPIEWAHMPSGKAYAYNNYVHHTVENNGDSDRYQITLYYKDPDWSDRKRLIMMVGGGYKFEDVSDIEQPKPYELFI